MAKEYSKSRQIAHKTIPEALKIIHEAGGELHFKEIISEMEKRISFTDYEKAILEKTGNVRWMSVFHFYTIDCIKAGFLTKHKGVWSITPEGEEALKLQPNELINVACTKYRKWKQSRQDGEQDVIDQDEASVEINQHAIIEQLEEKAQSGIREYIESQNPYEFQEIVAALLRSMGYHTPYVSPRGRDGGIDIVAYKDPLGTTKPKIKVQVKHRPEAKIPVDDIRSLCGVLNKEGDSGLFVTSGKFTNESERFARDSNIHMELIDFERFIDLWQQYYEKMSDEDKNLLPLYPIYFLGE